MLSQAEIDSFVADGFIPVRGPVPADVVRTCVDEVWSALAEHAVVRDDPATWREPVVRITCPDSEAFTAAGTHIEASYDNGGQWWVNHRSRARGLLALFLFTDVDADSAPTRVRPGSHRDVARVLAPAGDEGMPWAEAARLAARVSTARPTALATGGAGDVFICHPFLVHAGSWPHTGPRPRIIAQPGVALHDAFPLAAPLSPVELTMV